MKTALIIVVFLVGCITGGVASQVVAPPARAGTDVQKWEYWCFESGIDSAEKKPQAKANSGGLEGWEMVTAAYEEGATTTYCFKRPR